MELIETIPMPVMEVNEDKREIVVKNVDGTVGYVLENYNDEQFQEISRKIAPHPRNEREQKAIDILEEFLDDEIDLSGYDSFYQLYDFIEEEYSDNTIYGKLVLCVDGYKVEIDMGVNLENEKVYVYSAEDYQECTLYSKQFITELIYQIITAVKFKCRCDN